jgi:regulatory protein spx
MKKLVMYQKATCGTCKKQKEYLAKVKLPFDELDIVKSPPSREFLEANMDVNNLEAYINKHSKSYKENKLAGKKISKTELIELMLEDPNLIKRPILIDGKKVYFGYNEI